MIKIEFRGRDNSFKNTSGKFKKKKLRRWGGDSEAMLDNDSISYRGEAGPFEKFELFFHVENLEFKFRREVSRTLQSQWIYQNVQKFD